MDSGKILTRKNHSAWDILESYLALCRIEETIRFAKQTFDMENIRLLTYNSHLLTRLLSTLDAIGCAYIKEGDRIICEIASGKSGLYVARVIEVRFGSSGSRSLSGFLTSCLISVDPERLREIDGTIKWYNPSKGYGFIIPDEGGEEIFIHSSVLYQVGYKALQPGTRVLAKVFQSNRGLEARIIKMVNE